MLTAWSARREPDLGRHRLLLQPVLALGVSGGATAAGHRAPAPGQAHSQALRLPGRGAQDRRRAAADAPRSAPALPPGRARPLAHLSRHAAGAGAQALPAGDAGRPRLEQVRGLDGDCRAGRRPRRLRPLARHPARAVGRAARHCGPRRAPGRRRGERLRRRGAGGRRDGPRRVQALYRQYSEEAEALGVFGAPTFVIAGELFWGQDRLEFVDRKLAAMG